MKTNGTLSDPLPTEQDSVKYLIMAMDYFTKGVDTKPKAITSSYHSQAKYQIDVTNKKIIQGIKENTDKTPFSSPFRTEVVTPFEKLIQTKRFAMISKEDNEELLRSYFTPSERKRDLAATHLAHFKHKMAKYYGTHVLLVTLKHGNHFLHMNKESKATCQERVAPN
ncbi:hypothetical protein CTI12_AA524240 [Artemisia annua]|uniref:Uncharacterized protein n=1 Tax=Artemisia annua TaxID=35608 RepID=A0A2U1L6L4_ARTAN|nr:hypothetical protein CTI12_AA524240 [Artemisia annua]